MTTSRIDELVTGLAGVRDDEVPGPSTPGAQALLTAVTAESRTTTRTRRRHGRLAIGVVAATAAAAVAVVALGSRGPTPLRSYANAAMDIQRTHDTYRVHIKNIYADQREFHEAFAKLGLNVTLSIVPVSSRSDRQIIGFQSTADQIGTVLDCPSGKRTACPLTVELRGAGAHDGETKILIGRAARPGEVYHDQHSGAGDNPASLHLTGRTVNDALARLRERKMTAVYLIGEFKKDGSGNDYVPPPGWRPDGGRRVTGAWMRSSDSVTLLVPPAANDPAPDPQRSEFPGW
ncbi:hypothetical protein GCM10023196_004840 [Actinoallomurus vinaceus]|uniref:Uncharacterized protein n=1 Tax=Actinoallomurus vinaceus TaxID=1080074 RepID=A0ABP8U2G2_9ACTN